MRDIPDLDIKSLFRIIVLGPSFSGKNNLYLLILKHSPYVYAHLAIIARNPHQELYEYLRDKLDGFITFADPDSPPSVDQVRHTPMSSNKPELVIIDDYSNDKLLQKNLFSHYHTRHFKISTIFLSHSYFATDKMIRLNAEYVAILMANSKRDLTMVVKDFNIRGDQFVHVELYVFVCMFHHIHTELFLMLTIFALLYKHHDRFVFVPVSLLLRSMQPVC
ncbi:unnamed protein product [Phytophthora lilii]|uniref:Unnamed protein product n=1 Tax=Phytophthora lilii TaxID=2077276 RepID=A0A9W6TDR6_9STRA|nr:unnamed protein product [Phytophthora lilii]